MDDAQYLLQFVAVALVVGVPLAAFLIRANKELALRRQHDEVSEREHVEIKGRLKSLEDKVEQVGKDIAWIKAKLNGKH